MGLEQLSLPVAKAYDDMRKVYWSITQHYPISATTTHDELLELLDKIETFSTAIDLLRAAMVNDLEGYAKTI